MNVLVPIALILCGILAAANLIVARQPNARQMIDRLEPFQAYIGIAVGIIGLLGLVHCLLWLALYLRTFTGIIFMASAIVELLLGFLLGYGLINKYALAGSPEAAAKAATLRQKLIAIQTPLGLAGIVLGILCLILVVI